MRSMLLMALLFVAACDVTGIDFEGGDWGGGGYGGGGGGGGCCPTSATIRPVVTPNVHLTYGSAFQLQVRDLQGNPVVDLPGAFSSADTTVIAVTPEGWAEARSPGSTIILYGEGGALVASAVFYVGAPASDSTFGLVMHGMPGECGAAVPCAPAGSPIIDGWIGHSIDTRGVSLTFIGADGLQPTDLVAASPVPLAPCKAGDYCVTLTEPSPAHTWRTGEATLCLGVTVGDSVVEQAYKTPNNSEWAVTWSRPGLFRLRQTFKVLVRVNVSAPASAC